MDMDSGPWANYAYAVKLQQQQNQFQNNTNCVNNLNRNATTIPQQNCYQLNNFNQNQMYVSQNMESLLAHYNNETNGFSSTFNSHHPNTYDAEFFSNQFQNAAKASLSAGLFKSAKTKDNPHSSNNQLNTNHDTAGANFLSHHLNWMPQNLKNNLNSLNNLNINHNDLNNQTTKPFGVLPHQSLNNSVNSNVQQHHHHHHNQYLNTANSNNELNVHTNNHSVKSSCTEPNRHNNSHANKLTNQSNNSLNLPVVHQNFMHNNQLNNSMNSSTATNNQQITKSNNKNQIPHSSQADQYLFAMNNQQQMIMKQIQNHQKQMQNHQQLVHRQSTNTNQHSNNNINSSPSCVITSNNSSSNVNHHHHMNFKNNFIHSQNNNSACIIQNQMNKTLNNTYCSMVMGGIQINNYNVSNHNNLIISNQTASSNCPANSTIRTNTVVDNQQATNQVNNFIMNNMNSLQQLQQQQQNNNLLLQNGTNNNVMNNSNSSRCSSVASVNNLQQINESSSCSYNNFNTNSPSFNNTSQNNRLNNSNLNSSQHVPTTPNGQLNEFNQYNNNSNNSNMSFSTNNNSNTPVLSTTPGYYPTPPSSVNRSETLMSQSQHSIQSNSLDDQLTQFNHNQNHNQFNYNNNNNQKLISNNSSVGYSNNQQHLNQTSLNDNSSNCLPNLMNITPVSDTMSDTSKLNDSQCSTNALSMNLHNQQQLDHVQFNDELNMNLDSQQQNNFNHNHNHVQISTSGKKKKEKSKKKKKKSTNGNVSLSANFYHQQQQQYSNIYSNQNYFNLNNMQQQQLIQQQFNQQQNLIMQESQLQTNDQSVNNELSNQIDHNNQQCLGYENQNCLVNNQNLNESNCSNEHEIIIQQQNGEHLNDNILMEDKLATLEDDLKYLTESNECALNDNKEQINQQDKLYANDNSNHNGSIDESLIRHQNRQLINDQTSLNGSINNGILMNGSLNSGSITNDSPINDLNSKQYEYEDTNLDENYVNMNLGINKLNDEQNNKLNNNNLHHQPEQINDDKKLKKKKKKDKIKTKTNDLNDLNKLSTCKLVNSHQSPTSLISDTNLPLKNSIDNIDNSILYNKKIKIEQKDEYEFIDEFNVGNESSSDQLLTSTKKRKKVNCENVNKKNKSINQLNDGLIKSFNLSKDKKEEKSKKLLSNKILTTSVTKNKSSTASCLNNCETSSNSSCSSNSFNNLNSKKENQELIVGGQANGAINSKSINQNVVQINNKKIITGKNINNQLESKKNELSILNKISSDLIIKQDKKESSLLTNSLTTNKTSLNKLNNTATNKNNSTSNTSKRRSGEKKALTIREGLMRTGDFVISKDAIEKNQSLLWRIEGKSLLQLFKPVEENGTIYYQNTSSYSGFNPTIREKFVGVDVRIMGCSRTKITVEKLSINKSNGNGNIEGKLNETKDDNQFQPSQHQNNFTVYIQILISQTLDPHFISEIIEDNDEYFLSHSQGIDDFCLSKKSRIYNKIKWESSIIRCIETYPKCEAIPQENSGDLRCKFCYEKWSTHILNLTGEMYDPITLETIDNDELKLNKYAACDGCKDKVLALSNLLHQKYHFFIKCIEKVEEMRDGDENKKSHVILEQSLQDEKWIESLFKQLEQIWLAADQI